MRKLCDGLILCLFLTSCLPEAKLENKEAPIAVPTVLEGVDPLVQFQWHLHNTGSNYITPETGRSGADINLGTLHEDGITGKGITIIVSDEEAELTHEDLDRNKSFSISKNFRYNFLGTYGSNPFTTKAKASHGTAVSGVIAATMDNAVGGKGVSPDAQIGNYNFLAYQSGANLNSQLAEQAHGLTPNTVDIFNYSWGSATCYLSPPSDLFQQAIFNGSKDYRLGHGSIYVKAAGNEFLDFKSNCKADDKSTPNYYLGNANFEGDNSNPYFIIVGATNIHGRAANYSSPGANLWVSAPGGDMGGTQPMGMITTDVTGCSSDAGYSTSSEASAFEKGTSSLNRNCKYTSELQGTSFAAPVVSGIIALMLEVNPNLTWRDVKYILAKTAKMPSSPGTPDHPNLANGAQGIVSNYSTGNVPTTYHYDRGAITNSAGFDYHNWYGFGLVDATAAVTMANAGTYTSPFTAKLFKEFTIDTDVAYLPKAIPDGVAIGVSQDFEQNSDFIIESLAIELTTTDARASDLGVELTFSPSNPGLPVTTTVINANSFIIDNNYFKKKMTANAFYMVNAKGTWTVRVIDAYTNGISGNVTELKLHFLGHDL